MGERTGLGAFGCGKSDSLCCITANKVFDSARDKDCLGYTCLSLRMLPRGCRPRYICTL